MLPVVSGMEPRVRRVCVSLLTSSPVACMWGLLGACGDCGENSERDGDCGCVGRDGKGGEMRKI